MKIARQDERFVQKEPDAGFDPERNRRIINEVIEDTEKICAKKQREAGEQLHERTDAVATYLHNIQQGGNTSNISKYFGRKYLAYLRGQEVLQQIQKGLTIVKDGKIIKRAGD